MIVLATVDTETQLADRLIEQWARGADRHDVAARTPRARYHSLLARAGMRALLFTQIAQSEWQFRADGRGKLSAIDHSGRPGPAICISHTRGSIACGVGSVGALGIDVEAHRPRDFQAMAAWGFGPRECAAIAIGGAAAFYRIWTLREAMGKATGEGLALATDRRDRFGSGPALGAWRARIAERDWLLAHIHPRPGISLAVAALSEEGQSLDVSDLRRVDLGAPIDIVAHSALI